MKMEFKEFMNILKSTQEKTKDPEYFGKLSQMNPSEKDEYMNDIFRNITNLLGAQKADALFENELKSCVRYLYDQLQKEKINADVIEMKMKEIAECSTSIEYSVGGTFFLRGIYCPSKIISRIITNVSKGKLVKKEPKNKKDWFKYYFKEKNIVGAYFEKDGMPYFEYSEKTDNIEVFYSFSLDDCTLDSISAAFYNKDNKLDKYLHIDISSIELENSMFANLSSDVFYYEKYNYINDEAENVNVILNGKCNNKDDNVFYDFVKDIPIDRESV